MPSTRKKSNISSNKSLEERIIKIESEVLNMKKTIKDKENTNHKKFRFGLSTALIIISAIFFVFSIAGFWLKTNIVNTDVWVSKTSEVIQDPSVRNDISVALTDTLFTKFDVEQYVANMLPEKAEPLATPIGSSLKSLTQKEIEKVMQSQAFINSWEKLNRSAHSGLISSLQKANTNSQSSGDLMYFEGDKLMLNVQPIYAEIKEKIASKGLNFVEKVAPSQIDKQIQIAEVANMPTILLAFNMINKAGLLMLIPMLIFGIAGLLIALSRRRALLIFGISSIVLLIANVQTVYFTKYPFIDNFKNALQNSNSASAQSIFSIYTKDLIFMDRLAIILMTILVLFAFLAGPAKMSIWLRAQVSKLFVSKTESPVAIWLAKNANYLVTGLLSVTFLLVIFPLVHNVWYLIVLSLTVGVICILLLSLKSSSKPPSKN